MTESLPDSPHTSGSRRADRHRHRASRVRFAPVALMGAAAASAVIALSMSGTLAGFVAQITNNNNTAATGSLTMRETGPVNGVATTCDSNSTSATLNAANCTINKFGGSVTMVPGVPVSTTITITNTGTVAASAFTLTPGTCAQSNNGSVNGSANDACSKVTLAVVLGTTPAGTAITGGSGTLTALSSKAITLAPLAAGASASYTFTVTLPTQNTVPAPTADNAYQGLQVKQDLVWNFTS